MTKQANKPSAPVVAVSLTKALETIAAEIAGALHESISVSATIGELTAKAGKEIAKKPEMVAPFVDACRQLCDAQGVSEASVKVYMSHIRAVLRAMCDGYAPAKGATLRQMYEAVPKGTGRSKATGARTPKGETAEPSDGDVGETAKPRAMTTADVALFLFGHCDDQLTAALEWAKANEASFVRYVQANIAAAQAADAGLAKKPAPAKAAKPRKVVAGAAVELRKAA